MRSAPAIPTRTLIQWAGLFAGPLLAAACYGLLPVQYLNESGSPVPFTPAGRATAALMIWMATWWMTEAIDISATALLPIVFLPLAGAATVKQATAPFGNDLIFLFMGGFILALSMQRWGLDKRIALFTLRLVGTKPVNMIAGFMIATAMISAFVSNTATAAMMMPVGLSVIGLMNNNKGTKARRHEGTKSDEMNPAVPATDNFGLCLMLGIAYAASIGGIATIIGSPPNVFLVGYIRDTIDPAFRSEITFIKWMMIGVPLAVAFLPLAWLLLTRVLYPVRLNQIEGGREFIANTYRELGPMKRGEWVTMFVFFAAALLWMTRPLLMQITIGSGDYITKPFSGLSDAVIAILAALTLFVVPVEAHSRTFTMNWATAATLPWGILILFGGGLSLAAAIESNGVAEFIGAQMHGFAGISPLIVIIVVATAVIFFSEIASNTATATTLVPILAAMAPALGVHPYLLIIPAGIAASCAFMMPVGTPPNAIVFGTGYVTMPQMIKAGLWLNLIGIVLITLLAYAIALPVLRVGMG